MYSSCLYCLDSDIYMYQLYIDEYNYSILNNGEILKKCIINENFIEHLRSINPIYLKAETKQIFSGIIKKYDEMQNDWGSQVLFNFYKEHVGLIKELVVSKQDITDIEEDIQILGESIRNFV